MASKFELITDIYKQISNEVVRSPYNWQSFLSSVCHNYRLRFDEQLLVYAQRPDATAVLETVKWNNKFYRWVNRGAKGIAVFSESSNLKYYFDISDTHETKRAKPVPVWQYKEEYEADVIETLENSFGELENKDTLYNAVMSAADNVVEDNISDYQSDLLMLTKDSFLEELDNDIVSSLYKNIVKNSVAFMLLSRLGMNTDECFSRDDFKDIVNFNTPDTLNSIGYATSDISETVLYEISKTVKAIEKENRIIADNTRSDYTKAVNKNIERSADYDRTHLQNGKRLSDTKYRYAKSEKFDLELIWADEEDIPQGKSQSDVLQSDDIGQTEQSSVGNRPESESNGRKVDETDVRAGRIDGTDKSRQSDSLGTENEQSEKSSAGNRDERGNLQSVTDELPPLTDDNLILGILKNTDDDLTVSKKDISEYFKYHSNVNDRTNFIMQAYPDEYREFDVDNIRVGYKAEKDGLLLWKGAYLSRTEESFFTWNIVSEITEQLIDSGEYVTEDKKNNEPLQFSIFDFNEGLPEVQEIENIQTSLFPAFEVSQQLIDEALCVGTNNKDSILSIIAYMMKNKSVKENADFLKNLYGTDGTGFYFQDEQISLWYDDNGIKISKGNYANRSSATLITWEQAAKRIKELLDIGRYAPQEVIDKAQPYEYNQISSSLLNLVRDISKDYPNNEILLPYVQKLWKQNKGFNYCADMLSEKLADSKELSIVISQLIPFINTFNENNEILKYPQLHKPDEILQKLRDLQIEPLSFSADNNTPSPREYFITEDEIKNTIRGKESASEYRLKTYSFFLSTTDESERIKFLKDHFGWSGQYYNNNGIEYNPKGISISHDYEGTPSVKAEIKWKKVVKYINDMIHQQAFLYQKDLDQVDMYEKKQVAKAVMSFYNCTPFDYPKPDFYSYSDYWDSVDRIVDLFSNSDEVEQIRKAMIDTTDKVIFDDMYSRIIDKSLKTINEFADGTFTCFSNKEETIEPLRNAKTHDSVKIEDKKRNENTDILLPSKSPIWDEYRDIKRIYKDDIILYQVGDFFEVMGDDAKTVADKFDLVLTGRDVGYSDRIAMCGFPVRSKEKYIKGLNELGYAVVVSSLDNGVRREDSYLPDKKPTDKMPVGVIDYLANDGTVGYSREFYDEKEFVDEINDNSYSGVPTSVKVYNNPDTDEHISTSFLNDLDPPMNHFEIAEYEQSVKDETETAEPEQSEDKDKPLTAPQTQPKSRVQTFDLHPEIPLSERHNYNFAEKEIETVGKKERFRRNMAAIKVLKDCEFENRFATPEEQEILSGYVGWGGIPEAFDENNEAWADEFIELYETLSPDEYKTAMDSVLTAFYTPQSVISAIYKVLDNLGFKQGNILEPSCAIGNFIGMLPDSMKDSKMYGVEIDSISAGIAQQLYQTSSIMTSPFENAEMPDSFFDAVVGNVPFGDLRVTDKRYDKNKFLIHDYFFAKSLDKLRPGGIMCLVTSKGTMDKENTAVRKYIAQRADLLGAVRLPDNTFKGNAGTEVTSDILILQKRDRITDIEPDWVQLDTDENSIRLNKYFVDNPDMVLGEMVMKSGRFGEDSICKPSETESLETLLDKAVSNIKGEITDYYIDDVIGEDEEEYIPADPDVRNFSFTVVEGKVYYRENSLMRAVNTNMTAENRIKGMVAIRDCLRNLIEMQTKDFPDYEIQKEQEKLNSLYDNFSKKYGLINSRANTSVFCDDSSYYLLSSLEIIKEGKLERKADIFTKRTIQPHIAKTHADTSTEALGISIGEKAKVDMDFMCQLTGKTEQQIYEDLKGVIFLNPMYKHGNGNKDKYLTADEYLSGNVREKLDFAKRSAKLYPDDYTVNVEALEKVQPVDLTAAEISVQLGANWIPIQYIEQFMFELLETPVRNQWNIKVNYLEYTGEWNVEGKSSDRGNLNATSTYGTDRMNAYRIIENTLNMRDVRVFDYTEDNEGKRKAVLNQQETAAAQQKQKIIKQKFKDWIWSDPDRRDELCKLYNEKFNSIRPREYDGKHIVFGGMNPEITLTAHQRNAAARAIYGGNTLLAHCVGAGKTFEMTAIAQESKRLGLCNKSLFVVPNHLISQWASEYLTLYPTANILVATKKDFEKRNRKKFCAKIATGDYDAVIIGHSQFEKIPVSIQRQIACLENQIKEITAGIAVLKADKGENFTVKQLVATRKKLEEKMKRLNDQSRKDNVVTFEELGVDRLFVDESHYYKNLFTYSKMRNVGGISQVDAQKSSDLFMKCQYLDELTGSKGVIFATGTPISNSMVELFTVQRYLQYELLRKQNLLFFDAWAANYGETVNSIELKPEGTGYRSKTRFAKFNNLPELMAMFKECADIQTADMLKLPVPKANYHNISVKPSDIQTEMVENLADRAETIRAGLVDANIDNMLKVTNDGRKLALDQRLINPMLPDFEDSKVNICTNNVFEIWKKTADKKSTQLLFCDLSTPKKDGTFSVYNDIYDKLIAKGIPPEEIAFIHDADTDKKKADLFAKVRNGDVRVLLGSTQKMGAGTNVQDKLIAIHNLDCPWRPSDLEQRAGRIVRRGNENKEVEIYRYVTEGTFDAYLYQLVETKQKFISQIMTGKSPVRSMEDADDAALSYAEVKMLATGNPMFKEKMDLEIQLQLLTMLKTSYLSEKYNLEDKINKVYPQKIAEYKEEISCLEKDMQIAKEHPKTIGDKFAGIKIGDEFFSEKEQAGNAIINQCQAIGNSTELHHIGEYRGFELYVTYEKFKHDYEFHIKGKFSHIGTVGADAIGNITRLDNVIEGIVKRKTACENLLAETEKQLETAKNNAAKPFEQEEELQCMQNRLNEINIELNLNDKSMEIIDAEPDEMDIPQKTREQVSVR